MAARQCVLVTGANKGIGLATARELGSRGLTVFVGARDEAAGTEAAARLASEGIDARFIQLDVTRDESIEDARARIERATSRLDALVNNAGIAPRVRADITEATEEIFDEVIGVNLKGPYFLTQKVVNQWLANPGLSELKGGYKLIFVGSLSANTASINRGEYC
jgi:NAD(P)-dependent dehydrogenase (short-subunit alcohol dehydrogenase family)